MKLIVNSMSVPLIEVLVNAVVETGVFDENRFIRTYQCYVQFQNENNPAIRQFTASNELEFEQLSLCGFT
jgi:hypothetical protein